MVNQRRMLPLCGLRASDVPAGPTGQQETPPPRALPLRLPCRSPSPSLVETAQPSPPLPRNRGHDIGSISPGPRAVRPETIADLEQRQEPIDIRLKARKTEVARDDVAESNS